MATSYYLRTAKDKGPVTIFLRIRSKEPKINIIVSSGVEFPYEKWTLDRNGTAWKNFERLPEVREKLDLLEKMKATIDDKIKSGTSLTNNDVKKIINELLYEAPRRAARQAKEEAKRLAAERNRVTLNKFVKKFVEDIASGARQTDKGTNYCYDTVRAIRGAMNQFQYYQRDCHKNVDFDDVDMPFYYSFTEYLKKKNYSINTIGKVIADLKAILRVAYDEGYTNNRKWESRKFKATRAEVDSIYLTEEDLKKMMAVDLSGKEKAYEQVRDVFMVGVRLAQRVSDYNYLTEDMISTMTKHSIVEDPDPEKPGKTIPRIVTKEVYVANILQEKTNKRVTVPCHPQVVQILKKYDYHMPKLADHTINDYIKEIGEMAELNEKIEIIETKGGVETRVFKKKYEMITTHTARRTGATLMYLAGMDCWDIMKMTGHDSPTNLKKYIKADELQVVETIVNKYDYFD